MRRAFSPFQGGIDYTEMSDQIFSDNISMDDKSLLNDKEIARFLNFSPQWVRQQRRLRRRDERHALTLDPVMVGEKPRYDRDEFMLWYEQLKAAKRPPEGTKIHDNTTA
jgi:hypothetical protein